MVLELESETNEIVCETCVSCMQRQALPHNGGLCGTCASPLKAEGPSNPSTSKRWPHNHRLTLRVHDA